MTTHQYPVELAGVDLAGQNHVCAFFNTMDEEHRVLRSFYKGGFERGEKAIHTTKIGSPLLRGTANRLTRSRRQAFWAVQIDRFGGRFPPRIKIM